MAWDAYISGRCTNCGLRACDCSKPPAEYVDRTPGLTLSDKYPGKPEKELLGPPKTWEQVALHTCAECGALYALTPRVTRARRNLCASCGHKARERERYQERTRAQIQIKRDVAKALRLAQEAHGDVTHESKRAC